MKSDYEEDFAGWLDRQINLLQERNFEELDVENLLEELESLGSYIRTTIEGHLIVLLMHLLRNRVRPDTVTEDWNSSILTYRTYLRLDIESDPSLKGHPEKMLEYCYQKARRQLAKETGIAPRIFPRECPWTMKEIMGEE